MKRRVPQSPVLVTYRDNVSGTAENGGVKRANTHFFVEFWAFSAHFDEGVQLCCDEIGCVEDVDDVAENKSVPDQIDYHKKICGNQRTMYTHTGTRIKDSGRTGQRQ